MLKTIAVILLCNAFIFSNSLAAAKKAHYNGLPDHYQSAAVVFDFTGDAIKALADYDDFIRYEIPFIRIGYSTYASSNETYYYGGALLESVLAAILSESVQVGANKKRIKKVVGYPNIIKKFEFEQSAVVPNAYIKYLNVELLELNALIERSDYKSKIQQRYVDLYRELGLLSGEAAFLDKKTYSKKELGDELAKIDAKAANIEDNLILNSSECFFTQDYIQLWCVMLVEGRGVIKASKSGRLIFSRNKPYQKMVVAMRSLEKVAADNMIELKEKSFINRFKGTPTHPDLKKMIEKNPKLQDLIKSDNPQKTPEAYLKKWQENNAEMAIETLDFLHGEIIHFLKNQVLQPHDKRKNLKLGDIYFLNLYKPDVVEKDAEQTIRSFRVRIRQRFSQNSNEEKIQAALEKRVKDRKNTIVKNFNKKTNQEQCEFMFENYFYEVFKMSLLEVSDGRIKGKGPDAYFSLDEKAYNVHIQSGSSTEPRTVEYDTEVNCGMYRFTLAPLLRK